MRMIGSYKISIFRFTHQVLKDRSYHKKLQHDVDEILLDRKRGLFLKGPFSSA